MADYIVIYKYIIIHSFMTVYSTCIHLSVQVIQFGSKKVFVYDSLGYITEYKARRYGFDHQVLKRIWYMV